MSSTISNSSEIDEHCQVLDCVFSNGERYLIITSLFLVVAFSMAGNVPLCIAILCSNKKRNPSNLTTLNLVVSDLLVTLFCTPFVTLDMFVFGNWVFGPTMCRVVTFVQNTATFASPMSLLALTCEKFLAVRFPFRCRLRKKVVCRLMPVAWIVAMADSIAYVQFKKLKRYGQDKFYCIEDWPDMKSMQKAIIAKSTLFFGPMMLIIVLYSVTIHELNKRKNKFQMQSSRSHKGFVGNVLRKRRRQRKAVKIILVTLITVIVCWAPIQLFQVLLMFDFANSFSRKSILIGFTVCIWLFFSHCSVFPFVYFFMTQKGRETIAASSAFLKGRRRQGYSSNAGSFVIENSNTLAGSLRGSGRSSHRRSSRCSQNLVCKMANSAIKMKI